MQLERSVKQLISGQDREASKAFDELRPLIAPLIERHLARRYSTYSLDLREEATQETLLKVWNHRTALKWQGEESWNAFLRHVARNTLIDLSRRVKEVEMPEGFDAPSEEKFELEIEDHASLKMIYQAADLLWLGLDPKLSPETHTRQILAAQLFYLDNAPWQEVVEMLPPERIGDPPLNQETLDLWLSHIGVFRALAYHELYASYDGITAHLLHKSLLQYALSPENCLSDRLDALFQIACREGTREKIALQDLPNDCQWTWRETALVFLVFRYGFTIEQILRREEFSFTREEIDSITVKSHALFPFIDQMRRLLRALEAVPNRDEALKESGLWKRLAFQYELVDKLQHRAILDRIQGAAELAGTSITPNTLQAWISNCRLWDSLIKFCRKQFDLQD